MKLTTMLVLMMFLGGEAAFAATPSPEPLVREQTLTNGMTELIVTLPEGKEIARYRVNLKDHNEPATNKTPAVARWEGLRYGAFLCFNDNQFTGAEFSRNQDPKLFNPSRLDVPGWAATMKSAGMKYAVLTARHTSGFLLWDSATSLNDVGSAPKSPDVVGQFVRQCHRKGIAPGLYYCLWGSKSSVMPNENSRPIILAQLYELATRYGKIPYFWIDMKNWAPENLSTQEIYDLIKNLQPQAMIIMNQHIQEGTNLSYFPTDIVNGEVVVPPAKGHQAIREIKGKKYYLPFEFEPVSQRREKINSGTVTPLGSVGMWFTFGEGLGFDPSSPLPVPVLFDWIKQAYDRGASNVLLSLAPDHTGSMRHQDIQQLQELGKKLREAKLIN